MVERKKMIQATYIMKTFGDEEVEGTTFYQKWLMVTEEVAYKRVIN